jgi:methylthioxylose transferase
MQVAENARAARALRVDASAKKYAPQVRWVLAVVAWLLSIWAFNAWGTSLLEADSRLRLRWPPLYAESHLNLEPALLVPAVVGLAAIVLCNRLSKAAGFRRMVALTCLLAACWAVSLAASDGPEGLTKGAEGDREYLAAVDEVESPSTFLSSFVDRVDAYPLHVRGHPPGAVLALWGLDRAGLSGPGWAAALYIVIGISGTGAVLLVVRDVAGEEAARRTAPFLALAPAAIWLATSADAMFAGTAAWAVALLILGTSRRDHSAPMYAAGGGMLFGVSLMLTYGAGAIAIVPTTIALLRKRFSLLAVAALSAVSVLLVFNALGFNWLEGLARAVDHYASGAASHRPAVYFVGANLVAFSIAMGPAIFLAFLSEKSRSLLPLLLAGLATVAFVDITGLSKGEVERIWLLFVPWLLVACARIPQHLRRVALGSQVAAALLLETLLVTAW